MLRANTELKERGIDGYGSGCFGASRDGGQRLHNGIDYECAAGSFIFPVEPGRVTKLGYPYGDDLTFRYVEVTDVTGYHWRYFYVDPAVVLGDYITESTMLGRLQALEGRYPGITPHCHLEVKDGEGNYIDPRAIV